MNLRDETRITLGGLLKNLLYIGNVISKKEAIALLDAGADPTGTEALFEACQYGELDVIQRIAAFETSISALEHRLGESTIIKAISGNAMDAILWLLQNGATVAMIGERRSSALHEWAKYRTLGNAEEIMELFVARGAPITEKDHMGQNPLMIAIVNGNLEAIRLITAHGGHLGMPEAERTKWLRGETPQCIAAFEQGLMEYEIKYHGKTASDVNKRPRARI